MNKLKVLVYSTTYTTQEFYRIQELFKGSIYYDTSFMLRDVYTTDTISITGKCDQDLVRKQGVQAYKTMWLHIYIFCDKLMTDSRWDTDLNNLQANSSGYVLVLFKGTLEPFTQESPLSIKHSIIKNYMVLNINEIREFYEPNGIKSFFKVIDNTCFCDVSKIDPKHIMCRNYDVVIVYDEELENYAISLYNYLNQNYQYKIWIKCNSLTIGKKGENVEYQIKEIIRNVKLVVCCVNKRFLNSWITTFLIQLDENKKNYEGSYRRRSIGFRDNKKILLYFERIESLHVLKTYVNEKKAFFYSRRWNAYTFKEVMERWNWDTGSGKLIAEWIDKLNGDDQKRSKRIYDIYLSYHPRDFHRVHMVHRELSNKGINVWFDFYEIIDNSFVNNTENLLKIEFDAMLRCQIAMPCYTNHSQEYTKTRMRCATDYCRVEVKLIFDDNKIQLLNANDVLAILDLTNCSYTIDGLIGKIKKCLIMETKEKRDENQDVFISTAHINDNFFKAVTDFLSQNKITYYSYTNESLESYQALKYCKLLVCLITNEYNKKANLFKRHLLIANSLRIPIVFIMLKDNCLPDAELYGSHVILRITTTETFKRHHNSIAKILKRLILSKFYSDRPTIKGVKL